MSDIRTVLCAACGNPVDLTGPHKSDMGGIRIFHQDCPINPDKAFRRHAAYARGRADGLQRGAEIARDEAARKKDEADANSLGPTQWAAEFAARYASQSAEAIAKAIEEAGNAE